MIRQRKESVARALMGTYDAKIPNLFQSYIKLFRDYFLLSSFKLLILSSFLIYIIYIYQNVQTLLLLIKYIKNRKQETKNKQCCNNSQYIIKMNVYCHTP